MKILKATLVFAVGLASITIVGGMAGRGAASMMADILEED